WFRLRGARQPDGSTESFTYNEIGQILTHTTFEGGIVRHIYDDGELGTGALIEKQYFKDEATYQNGSGDPDESFTYVYDA
ncbi:MAG TPA: hypothetical protein DCY03_32570, partial [Planctomycetaceae bacterium]|nr:hypothetical protein [Planctomycetaceae bacterium]